jgi:hypothetical protein
LPWQQSRHLAWGPGFQVKKLKKQKQNGASNASTILDETLQK